MNENCFHCKNQNICKFFENMKTATNNSIGVIFPVETKVVQTIFSIIAKECKKYEI